jgi:hypothetical protein
MHLHQVGRNAHQRNHGILQALFPKGCNQLQVSPVYLRSLTFPLTLAYRMVISASSSMRPHACRVAAVELTSLNSPQTSPHTRNGDSSPRDAELDLQATLAERPPGDSGLPSSALGRADNDTAKALGGQMAQTPEDDAVALVRTVAACQFSGMSFTKGAIAKAVELWFVRALEPCQRPAVHLHAVPCVILVLATHSTRAARHPGLWSKL